MKSINNFGLTDKQVKEAQEKYELLEPLMDSYLNPDEKKELRQKICQILGITKRTLRRYLSNCKKNGIKALARKKRNDAGKYRLFSKEILTKSIELLNQNPYRSVRMLIKLMKQDEKLEPKVSKISESILYYYLKKAGYDSKNRGHIKKNKQSYHRFEADYANQLWQSDARHGIPLPDPDNPDKVKMTYCFVWLDDYSRKILFAKYYWNEKQASLDDSYRNTVLCWGVPEKIYLDNGYEKLCIM